LTVWECLYILKFCDHNYSYILNYYLMAIADFCRFHICRHRHWLTNPLLFLYKWEIQILFMHSHNILIIYNLHTKHWCRSFAPRFATNLPCTWCQIITFVFTFIISTIVKIVRVVMITKFQYVQTFPYGQIKQLLLYKL
jgi:hypothetical protein